MTWAVLLVLFAVAAASLVQVRSGEATVITRFGNPSRVLLEPGATPRVDVLAGLDVERVTGSVLVPP